ncbi:DUF1186 domain-containing protein [Paenibacillus macerans]|nr:DUF1186 domain-containing protein [Paenibacillus macerans]MED4955282.1 DUF1186 domain-containing protein [Paenibacillus macerans]
MKTLIESIRYPYGKFPREQLQQIIDHKDEAIPYLLQIMEELKEDEETFLGEPYRYDHLFAMYLLAQFRVKELYPLLVEILLKTGNLADEILGDIIAEGLGQILASVYNGDPEPLMRLIESPQANEYARGQALKAIVTLVFDRQLTREFAMDYMKQLLNGRLSDTPYYLNAEIVSCSSDLYPLEVYEDIKRLYESGELEEGYIDFGSVESALKKTQEEVMQGAQRTRDYSFIDDTIAEMEGWASFQPKRDMGSQLDLLDALSGLTLPKQSPVKVSKVGRNDPCPCGSGKKYKKCCGK